MVHSVVIHCDSLQFSPLTTLLNHFLVVSVRRDADELFTGPPYEERGAVSCRTGKAPSSVHGLAGARICCSLFGMLAAGRRWRGNANAEAYSEITAIPVGNIAAQPIDPILRRAWRNARAALCSRLGRQGNFVMLKNTLPSSIEKPLIGQS